MKEAAAELDSEARATRRKRGASRKDGHDVRAKKDGHDVSAFIVEISSIN